MSAVAETDLVEQATADRKSGEQGELDLQVVDLQKRITDLNRVLQEVERERVQVEDSRRRFSEFQTGREEMRHELTRALGLLEEAEANARRDAEQMARSITDMRDAIDKVEVLEEVDTASDNWKVQLTRNLTTLENARMELNAARLKWPLLNGDPSEPNIPDARAEAPPTTGFMPQPQSLGQWCLWGIALTWPLVLLGLGALLFWMTTQ